MNTRERFKATFNFMPVDRPLLDYHGEPETTQALCEHFGVRETDDLLSRLQVDVRTIAPCYKGPELPKGRDAEECDIWGVWRKPVAIPNGVYMEPIRRPWEDFTTVAQVESYPWPRADWYDFSGFPEACERYHESVIVFGRAGLMDLINGVSFGRGMDQVMIDIAERNDALLALFQKRFEFVYDYARRGLESADGGG